MSKRRDGALAVLTLAVFGLAFVSVEAPLSLPALLAGALGTIVFEALATRVYEPIRRYWERPTVQAVAFAGAFALAAIGAWAAPSSVLSAGIGALVTYLVVLGFVILSDVTV